MSANGVRSSIGEVHKALMAAVQDGEARNVARGARSLRCAAGGVLGGVLRLERGAS